MEFIKAIIAAVLKRLGLKAGEMTVDAAIVAFTKALTALQKVAEHQDCECEKHEQALKEAQDAAAKARAEADRARDIATKIAGVVQ